VKSLCVPVLAHRLVLAGRGSPAAADAVIEEVVDETGFPG
jgi:hypothetical protein